MSTAEARAVQFPKGMDAPMDRVARRSRILSDAQLAIIFAARDCGVSCKAIARQLRVDHTLVRKYSSCHRNEMRIGIRTAIDPDADFVRGFRALFGCGERT